MPRFHFNVRDGVRLDDTEGQELADWEEARVEAVRYAGMIIKNDAQRLQLGEDWAMEVTDERGLILFRLDFHIMEAPAMLGTHPRPSDQQGGS